MSLDTAARVAVAQTRERLRKVTVPDSGQWVRRRRRRRVVRRGFATLIAIGVFAGTALVWAGRGDSTDTVIATPAPKGGVGAGDADELLCGAELPRPVAIPAGYVGPASDTVEDAPQPATHGQLVLSWTAAPASIEVRWPADPAVAAQLPPTVPPVPAPSPGFGVISATPTQQLPSGRFYSYIAFQLPDQQPDCQTMQLTAFGGDAAAVNATLDTLQQRPLESDDPLVAGSRTVESAPTVSPCPTPPGVTSPNRGGPAPDAASHATPIAALVAFVDADRTLPQSRYVELHLPDGSITYGWQTSESNWVVLVHVVTTNDGWAIDSWSASGC